MKKTTSISVPYVWPSMIGDDCNLSTFHLFATRLTSLNKNERHSHYHILSLQTPLPRLVLVAYRAKMSKGSVLKQHSVFYKLFIKAH